MWQPNAASNFTFRGSINLGRRSEFSEWGIDPQVDTWAVRHSIWDGKKADDKYAAEKGLKVIPV